LDAGMSADHCKQQDIAAEFIIKALTIYENTVTDSKQQFQCLQFTMCTLLQMDCFSSVNYNLLATKLAQHSVKLLILSDKCKALCGVAHLFWNANVSLQFKFSPLLKTD